MKVDDFTNLVRMPMVTCSCTNTNVKAHQLLALIMYSAICAGDAGKEGKSAGLVRSWKEK